MTDPRDAAPQPPPVPKTICGHCQMEICRGETTRHYGFYSAHEESRCRDLLKFRIAALEAQLAEAQSGETLQTVTGALVHKRDRYIRQLEEKIARQREDLRKEKGLRDEVQEQLAMAVEALRDAQKWATRWAQTTEHRDPNANDYGPYNQHPRGYAICPIPDWEVKQKRDDYAYALAATSEAVAQHTAEIEARAIQKCQRCVTPQQLAEIMHETYERQALIEGWTTQESCRVPFAELPEANKRVMLAVAKAVLWATPDLSRMEAEVERRGAAKDDPRFSRIYEIVTRLLAEPPDGGTGELVEIATICEARAAELEGA